MAPLKFLSLATASLFLLQGTSTSAEDVPSNSSKNEAKELDCTAAFNSARKAVGFPELTKGEDKTLMKELNSEDAEKTVNFNAVCEALKNIAADKVLENEKGFVSYHAQAGASGDCKAAVEYFTTGYAAFNGNRPSAYKKGEAPYNSGKAVAFVSTYYPKKDGTVECAFVKCAAGATASTKQEGQEAGTTDPKATNGVVCFHKPAALKEGTEPFTKDEWKAFEKLEGSAYTAVPSLIALIAAAAGFALF